MEDFQEKKERKARAKRPVKPHLLLVEDDPNLSLVIKEYLEMMDFEITHCSDGAAGLTAFKRGKFSLVLLDIMMPKKDGFSVAEDIRKVDDATPIVFLTAKALKEDRIKGFQSGCDDYITKPFSTQELSLRINAILKRCNNGNKALLDSPEKVYKLGRYTFDYDNLLLKSPGSVHSLTKKEGALLKLLCMYKNRLLPRDIALNTVWGGDDYFTGRSMDVFIAKLRKHLKDDPSISITNVHGLGFKLEMK
jgi:DNA-binding response OmpR family regulator